MSNLQVFPYVQTQPGLWSMTDTVMSGIWMQLEAEGKIEHLFYDGSTRDLTGWLQFIKRSNLHLVIIADIDKKAPVHLAWISDPYDTHAWLHHCAIGPYRRGAWEALRDYLRQFDFLHILIGLTPATNEKALKITFGICKWHKVGEIPGICNLAYEGRRVPGVVSYYQLREHQELGKNDIETVSNQAIYANLAR